MSLPGAWQTILLALAAYRIFRLLSEDTILDRPRKWLVRLPANWDESISIPDDYRLGLAKFISCSLCMGFWISVSVWLLWQLNGHWTEVLATPFAISALVVFMVEKLDPKE